VILAAFTGSLLGDQLYFFIGRFYGRSLLQKRPHWQARTEKLNHLIERWGDFLIIGFRFFYGLRTVSPFVFGMSNIRIPRFFLLNATGAALWASSIGTLGYLFGRGLQLLPIDITQHSWEILSVGFVAGATIWLIYQYRSRKKLRQPDSACTHIDSN
jgi:membrane protein DedA with SNARE-associated domain